MTAPDYAALEAALTMQQEGRVLPPELVAEVWRNPMLTRRFEREQTLEWLRRQSATEREGFQGILREIRERWDAEQVLLEGWWAAAFGDDTDRGLGRDWWDAGLSLEAIAARFAFVYDAEVTVAMIAAWQDQDRWPQRTR